jgi:hypothetical protein
MTHDQDGPRDRDRRRRGSMKNTKPARTHGDRSKKTIVVPKTPPKPIEIGPLAMRPPVRVARPGCDCGQVLECTVDCRSRERGRFA